MIIVAGTISVDPEDFEAYRAAATAMIEATLQEDGCQTYNFAQSVVDPSEVRIFEVWESREHLEAHFNTAHMATFRSALGELKVGDRNLGLYQADKVADL
ncbi:MAG: putative quinol monooxygenase [Acidimicrobiia bacterium]|nr:putative quinol monooxygenase [Acidimicrobiia bacterium]